MRLPKFFGKQKRHNNFLIIRRINGLSMVPGFQPGRMVIGIGYFYQLRPNIVIVFQHNGIEKLKRISQIKDNRLFVTGDNPALSTDSRKFGWISTDNVKAKVIWPRF